MAANGDRKSTGSNFGCTLRCEFFPHSFSQSSSDGRAAQPPDAVSRCERAARLKRVVFGWRRRGCGEDAGGLQSGCILAAVATAKSGRFVQLEKFHIFDHALLEAEKFSFGVRLQRRGQVEQPAQVVKMGLVGGGFLRANLRPFCFEFSRGHGSVANSASFSWLGMGGLYQLDKGLARVLPVRFRGKEAHAHGCLPEAPSSFAVIVSMPKRWLRKTARSNRV